jgi:hypothetical protein
VFACEKCGHRKVAYNPCGNRRLGNNQKAQ